MGRPRSEEDLVQVSIRLPAEWLARIDKIAKDNALPGSGPNRNAAVRQVIAAGLDELERTKRRA